MKKRTFFLFFSMLMAAVLCWFLLAPSPPAPRAIAARSKAPPVSPPTTTAVAQTTLKHHDRAGNTVLRQALADTSLAGTTVPAGLAVDTQGHLIVKSSTKDVLDYFLSLTGERSQQDIEALLGQWASATAGKKAASDLLVLLHRYREYGKQFSRGDYAPDGMDQVADKLRQRQQLRDDIFGSDTAAALFADDNRYDRFSLQRHEILSSEQSDAQKARALQALRASLPEPLARQYQRQYRLQHLHDDEQALRKQGADNSDLFAYHQQAFGDQAALRLQALEEKRAQWQQRYQDYARQRDILLHSGLAAQDRQQQIEQLRQRLFTSTEQKRVAALDRIEQ
ncbi:lipase foldase protein [Alcanivorax hongdengensis A-11-3]|uniref:Lipase chaperone n=1 Tax=Alcanivorax hongdengensis A-11-3 TaxID=1177179 RepID=L0WFK2_9GAMM|nr:lipase secretion chaperone [Alcanivorax hongdengensis]EKF75811.1 lipase foldase protein [Alcanivorax hongdengensis A-11-3]